MLETKINSDDGDIKPEEGSIIGQLTATRTGRGPTFESATRILMSVGFGAVA
jgi:hypothetical protein